MPNLPEKISTCLLVLNELLPDDVSECGPGVACGVEIEAWREAVMQRLEEEGVAATVALLHNVCYVAAVQAGPPTRLAKRAPREGSASAPLTPSLVCSRRVRGIFCRP
jgi:hypothetical protein